MSKSNKVKRMLRDEFPDWKIVRESCHIKIEHTSGAIVFVSKTTSDPNAFHGIRRDIRNALKEKETRRV